MFTEIETLIGDLRERIGTLKRSAISKLRPSTNYLHGTLWGQNSRQLVYICGIQYRIQMFAESIL